MRFNAVLWGLLLLAGCGSRDGSIGSLDVVWGKRGLMPGEFIKPRAIAIDRNDRIYTVDMKAAIQVFDVDGNFINGWLSPDHTIGRPSGLCIDNDGTLVVADSHYHQILFYSPDGKLVRKLGGDSGDGPLVGMFGYIGDIAVDSKGFLYVGESQTRERITKLTPEGVVVKQWGGRGPEPGQFQRPRALTFDRHDRLFIADACNHRVQVFDTEGKLLTIIGAGQLNYPFDVAIAPDETIYVAEWGGSRVQRFNYEGKSLGFWGSAGRKPGQLENPWALAIDSKGRVNVVDSENHRIQRVVF